MAYFNKYYFDFEDSDYLNPAIWRVDIMDSEGATPTIPYLLQPSGVPLITERVDADENKDPRIIGRQITFNYEYRGPSFPNDPLPEEFFESSERRFRVEVRRNGILDGVYYIRPDFSQRPHIAPPVTITLKAVDGLSYAKAIPFNIYDEDQKIFYDKISWYEAIITRSLNLVIDPNTPINVINSLYPTNIESGVKLLFGCYVHIDIFYDFVKGATNVYDVLLAFAKAMYARIFIERNEVWFIRTQDLTGVSFTAERYTGPAAVSEIAVPDMVRWVAPSSSADAIPINVDGLISPTPGMKKVDFTFDFQSINQVTNFDFSVIGPNPEEFIEGWFSEYYGTYVRVGAGTIDDPYRLRVPEELTPNQTLTTYIANVRSGEILDIEIKVRGFKSSGVYAVIRTGINSTDYYMDASGNWILRGSSGIGFDRQMFISTPKRSKNGTLSIKSKPIPTYGSGIFEVLLQFTSAKRDPNESPGNDAYVDIFPVKLGVISNDSAGRFVSANNAAEVSGIREEQPALFLDTGDDGLSNTIFTGENGEDVVNSWGSNKAGVEDDDIERHMARSFVDQAPRAVQTWSGTLHSNNLPFYSLLEFQYLAGKRFLQLSDRYNNRDCEHSVVIAEVFTEGNASVSFTEYDIEDKEDEN